MASMDNLVSLISKLQEAATLAGEHSASSKDGNLPTLLSALPQVVAVGGQSSGKSSVLEAIVGRAIFPRSAGITTRRPLFLQLSQEKNGNDERAAFLHKPKTTYRDFNAVKDEISKETDRLCPGDSVSAEPIHLTIYSPNVPTLQVVDLPGLTKVATEGQSQSIVQQLEDMSVKYIKSSNSIVLAVSPANADIATSDAMRLAREHDPEGKRTLGVITKLDLMEEGTSARAILENRVYRLKKGWVGVINPSTDGADNASTRRAREKENEFFQNHQEYSGSTVGTEKLISVVSSVLESHILKQLPKIQSFLNESIQELEKQLKELGGDISDDRAGQLHQVLSLCQLFDKEFEQLIDGGEGGGERLRKVFETDFRKALTNLPFSRVYSLENVRRVIDHADGFQRHLLAPEIGIRKLLVKGINLLNEPATKCCEDVHAIMREIVSQALHNACEASPELKRFARLRETILNTAYRSLESQKKKARNLVDTLVSMQESYFSADTFRSLRGDEQPANTADLQVVSVKDLDEGGGEEGETEGMETRQIALTVCGYVDSVCTDLLDALPKAIVHTQLQQAKGNLLKPMYEQVGGQSDSSLKSLFKEDEGTAEKRKNVRNKLQLLKHADSELRDSQLA